MIVLLFLLFKVFRFSDCCFSFLTIFLYPLLLSDGIAIKNQEIPYCFNFSLRVERDICRILAALDLFPLNFSRVLIIWRFSISWSETVSSELSLASELVVTGIGAEVEFSCNSIARCSISIISFWHKIEARSITFFNSRTFPGQLYRSRSCSASSPICTAYMQHFILAEQVYLGIQELI